MFKHIIYNNEIKNIKIILTNKPDSKNIYYYRLETNENKFKKIRVYNIDEIKIEDVIKKITIECIELDKINNYHFLEETNF